jgi:hypothetical protein
MPFEQMEDFEGILCGNQVTCGSDWHGIRLERVMKIAHNRIQGEATADIRTG